jgi:branched-chain amino acid transport system substrate-binding protein
MTQGKFAGPKFVRRGVALLALVLGAVATPLAARAAEPIKLGFSAELTGELAVNGKQELLALQIWQEDVNAKGGLLGRPVQLLYYDDQSQPSNVPGIYAKLIEIDHVDLLFAQSTNISAPAMPTVIEHKMVFMDSFAIAVNERFHYDRFFQIMPYGPDGKDAISHGFFDAAMTMTPKPQSVALVGADAEFSKSVLEGARANAQRAGLKIVYDKVYPPATVDFTPILRAIKAAGADIVYAGSYPGDTAGILRAAGEIGLEPKMFGGGMVGLQAGAIKQKFGEQLNGVVGYELFVHEPTMSFAGIDAFLATYQSRAAAIGIDPLGYYIPPFTYAAVDIVGQAVTAVGSLDQDKIAQYIHATTFKTIVGDVAFGADGEWATPRILTVQYRGIHGHDLQQFTRPGTQVILDPPQFKSGELRYPFSEINHE